jgi:hypothetical protein
MMPTRQVSLANKIVRVTTAMKNGQLAAHMTAKQLGDDDQGVQRSWGPAMRR